MRHVLAIALRGESRSFEQLNALITRWAGDDPIPLRVEEFEADGEARFARGLAVGDAGERLEGARGCGDFQAVVDLPLTNTENARSGRTDILREGGLRTRKLGVAADLNSNFQWDSWFTA
jgi:hypothetical protein